MFCCERGVSMKKVFFASMMVVLALGAANAGALDNPTNVFEHFPNVNVDAHVLKIAQLHFQDIREGIVPADTNELARARRIPLLDWNHANPRRIAKWFRHTLHAWAIGGEPYKEWRISNKIDMWRWTAFRSDAFWISQHLGERGHEMNPLIAGLRRLEPDSQWSYVNGYEKNPDGSTDWERPIYSYVVPTNSYEILKQVCAEDECARDVIVAIGLVCKDLPLTKKLAMELARESEVNWPVYALRIPYAEAAKLLGDRPRYAQLLSNLAIREMKPGLQRCIAIENHLARFPDYTEEDMPKTSIALNTRAELAAIAGADRVNAEDLISGIESGIELWLKYGGCPEDVALVAEQLLTINELKEVCRRFPMDDENDGPHLRMRRPWSVYCSHNNGSGRYLIVDGAQTLRRYVRQILAKRLMRAEREEEAIDWFDDSRDIVLAKRYLQVKTIAEQDSTNVMRRFNAYMTLGALMRQGADRLFGTELEPDNMICNGQHACEWAKYTETLKGKRKIDETRRFHYLWRTADCYFKAGDVLTHDIIGSLINAQANGTCYDAVLANRMPDRLLRDFAFWNHGDILRYRDPKRAYALESYYQVTQPVTGVIGLFSVTNSVGVVVTNEAWQVAAKLPSPFQEWRRKDNWLGDDPLVVFTDEMFVPQAVALPQHKDDPENLLRVGIELFDAADREGDFSDKGFAGALYAFYLAGQKGSALGYTRCCAFFIDQIGDYALAIPFIKAAMSIDPQLPHARYYYARILCEIGMCGDAYAIVRAIVDHECPDRETELFALGLLCKYYQNGQFKHFMTEEMFDKFYARYRRLAHQLGLQ